MRIKNITTNEIAEANESLTSTVAAALETHGIEMEASEYKMDRWGASKTWRTSDRNIKMSFELSEVDLGEDAGGDWGLSQAYEIVGNMNAYGIGSAPVAEYAEYASNIQAVAAVVSEALASFEGKLWKYEVEFEQPTLQGTHIEIDRENLKGALEAKDVTEGLYITMTPDAEIWEATNKNETGWTSSTLSSDDKILGHALVYDVKRVRVFFTIEGREYQVQMKNVTAARVRSLPVEEASEE